MQTITDYKIIAASLDNTMKSFSETIDALIEDGWQPHGQPFIAFDNRQRTNQAKIGQAMVKYAEQIVPGQPHPWGTTQPVLPEETEQP